MLASMAEREQLRTLSVCKDSANRAKYQRKTVFLCISEMQPIFDQRSKIQLFCEIIAESLRKLSMVKFTSCA